MYDPVPIIRNNDRVKLVYSARHEGAEAAAEAAINIVLFTIKSDYLLVVGDNPSLANRQYCPVRYDSIGIRAERCELLQKFESFLILAHDSTSGDLSSQCPDVADNIRCASGMEALACHVDDRNRSFWRNPLDSTPDIAIKHQIANDKDADAGETTE
jgi:hypothetical protein